MVDRAADDFAAIKQRQEEIRLIDQGDEAIAAWLHNEFDKVILEALNSDVSIPYNNDTPLFPVQIVTIVVPRDSEEAKLIQSGRSGPSCGYKYVEENK